MCLETRDFRGRLEAPLPLPTQCGTFEWLAFAGCLQRDEWEEGDQFWSDIATSERNEAGAVSSCKVHALWAP